MNHRKTIPVFAAILAAVLGMTVTAPAQPVVPKSGAVGPVTSPHGFPQSFSDSATPVNTVVPCIDELDPLCITTPPEVAGTFNPGFGDEGFYWMAAADATPPLVGGGIAQLTLAIEAAYGGAGAVNNGDQMVFGRLRIRVDVPSPGDYLVTHPYGTKTFTGVTVADGINYTEDIGAFDNLLVADPIPTNPPGPVPPSTIDIRAANNFMGAQASPLLQSLLKWDPAIPPAATAGYLGDPGVLHTVIGSPTGNNFFRVEKIGDPAVVAETNLFSVMGKLIATPAPAVNAHTYPPAIPKTLQNVGGIYRPLTAPGYPVGYPVYYEDFGAPDPSGDPAALGLRLTICPAVDPMCISAPVDPLNAESVALNAGDESFFWSADARVDMPNLPGGRRGRGLLVLGLEAAFGGDGSVHDGNQMVFGRIRIRIDTPRAGTYTVTHPYGEHTFTITQADMTATGGRRAINFTEDIGGFNPFQYDPTFQGQEPSQMFDRALYGKLGPQFLTWTDYLLDPTLNVNGVQYIGNPAVDHEVTGSPLTDGAGAPQNYFRIRGPLGLDIRTNSFSVSGKVYNPDTFEVVANPAAPVATNDLATTSQNTPVSIAVLGNDTVPGTPPGPIPAGAIITLGNPEVTGPANGTAAISGNQILYTPSQNFFGTDSFTYTVTVGGIPSNPATVTVTVNSVEAITVTRALVNTRGRLAIVQARGPSWAISGRTTIPGAVISIHAGNDLTGPLIARVTASRRGAWTFNRRAPGFIPPVGTTPIFISSSGGATFSGNATVR
ncbi:MAG: cadherin-like domain-containing protein [Syntrophobacteraceae bacterium]